MFLKLFYVKLTCRGKKFKYYRNKSGQELTIGGLPWRERERERGEKEREQAERGRRGKAMRAERIAREQKE